MTSPEEYAEERHRDDEPDVLVAAVEAGDLTDNAAIRILERRLPGIQADIQVARAILAGHRDRMKAVAEALATIRGDDAPPPITGSGNVTINVGIPAKLLPRR